MWKAAKEYIESRTNRPGDVRSSFQERVKRWQDQQTKSGWSPVKCDGCRQFAKKLRIQPSEEPKADLEHPTRFWLPTWLQELYAGDLSQLDELIPEELRDLSKYDKFVSVVELLLKTSRRRAKHSRFLYWIDRKNEESGSDRE